MKIKEILLGGLGSGKTTLILKRLIPSIKDYMVFDFCDEYRLHVENFNNVTCFNGLVGSLLKKEVTKSIDKLSDDTIIIIDNANFLYFPNADKGDRGYGWLMDLLKNKHSVLVFQNPKQILNTGISRDYNVRNITDFKRLKTIDTVLKTIDK